MTDHQPPRADRPAARAHPGVPVPAPSVDLDLLERTLREALPGIAGATEEEVAAVEARLGVPFSEELTVLLRVVGSGEEDSGGGEEYDHEGVCPVDRAVGCDFFGLEHLSAVDAEVRGSSWYGAGAGEAADHAAAGAAVVRHVAGSAGWIAFGSNGGDTYAVDLTPGPAGHHGQVILVGHEQSVGADLVSDSLTDFVLARRAL
ncbi:SMI1/KNR4 family protein [Streptomyces manipurensis]|uniref:SMI1/KNR4 family protein n=1 Tax=Streptomyces manipurensis TaxID=1077945 RepID=UPI003C6FE8E8